MCQIKVFLCPNERGQCNVKNKRQLDIQEIEKEIVSTSEHILLLEPPFLS